MSEAIPSGQTLGMLGGGQLGRMFIQAAHRHDYRVHVYCQQADEPAAQIADEVTLGDWDDLDKLHAFAAGVAAVSYEFENVPSATAAAVSEHCPVRPGQQVLHICQDRIREKEFFASCGIPTGKWASVITEADIEAACAQTGFPAVLKTSNGGYDGKGQVMLKKGDAASLRAAWKDLGSVPCILEAFVPFTAECSVIVARGEDGGTQVYGPIANIHTHHILDISSVPADVDDRAKAQAVDIATRAADSLNLVGVLCLELFQLENPDGSIRFLANEMAPRPHNSGHLTIEAYSASQFDQQVLTVSGHLPAAVDLKQPAAMANLLGDLWEDGEPDWTKAKQHNTYLHLYGKTQARGGRKMGHLTVLANSADSAASQAAAIREHL